MRMPSNKNMTGEDMVSAKQSQVSDGAKQTGIFFSACFISILVLGIIFTGGKVYAAGGDILWQYDDAKVDKQEALSSVVDSAGNTITVGYTQNASEDFYTTKVKADGSGTLWSATFDLAGGADWATLVTVDQNDDVLVSGYAWNGNNYDFHTIKYSSTDGSVVWQNTFNASAGGSDIPSSIATDSLV